MTLQHTKPKAARVVRREPATESRDDRRRRHWLWLLAGFPFAFAVPFLLADTLDLNRDLFYGLYALAVAGFVAAWARDTRLNRLDLLRNWRWGLALGAVGAAALAFNVVRMEDATDRPGGFELVAAILWRGVLYGATDGVLLSVFPILAVFAAFAGTRLRQRMDRQGRDRDDRHAGLDRDYRRLPPRILGLPLREGAKADRWRRYLERSDADYAEPVRGADRPCGPPCERGRAQQRNRDVPASARESVVSRPHDRGAR